MTRIASATSIRRRASAATCASRPARSGRSSPRKPCRRRQRALSRPTPAGSPIRPEPGRSSTRSLPAELRAAELRAGQGRIAGPAIVATQHRVIAGLKQLVGPAPLRECAQDVRRIAVDLRESARDGSGVEVGRVYPIGVEPTCWFEAELDEALVLGLEVVHQVGDMVEALLPGGVHVSVDRQCLVMLDNELDHQIAEIPEGVRDVGLLRRAPVREPIAVVMMGDGEGPRAKKRTPAPDCFVDVVDQVCVLEKRIAGLACHRGNRTPGWDQAHGGSRQPAALTGLVGLRACYGQDLAIGHRDPECGRRDHDSRILRNLRASHGKSGRIGNHTLTPPPPFGDRCRCAGAHRDDRVDERGDGRRSHDQEGGVAWAGPLVVLTSKESASASEIFAGAIQDYKRGIIVGDPTTHGKGTVQSLLDLGQYLVGLEGKMGALKLTIQQFYLPDGKSTQRQGVLSDIVLPALTASFDNGEADLDYALPNDQVQRAKHNDYKLVDSNILAQLRTKSADRVKSSASFDRLLRRIDLFRQQKDEDFVSLSREKFLKRREEIDAEQEEEDKILDQQLPKKEVFHKDYYHEEVLNISRDYVEAVAGLELARAG